MYVHQELLRSRQKKLLDARNVPKLFQDVMIVLNMMIKYYVILAREVFTYLTLQPHVSQAAQIYHLETDMSHQLVLMNVTVNLRTHLMVITVFLVLLKVMYVHLTLIRMLSKRLVVLMIQI